MVDREPGVLSLNEGVRRRGVKFVRCAVKMYGFLVGLKG